LLVGDLNQDLSELPQPASFPDGVRGADTAALHTGFAYRSPDSQFWRVGGFATLWNSDSGPGSYWFDGAWERLDHAFFYLPQAYASGAAWETELTAVQRPELLTGAGLPHRYNPRTGTGVSDHLPLVVSLSTPRPQ
jgi:hypothetical protein